MKKGFWVLILAVNFMIIPPAFAAESEDEDFRLLLTEIFEGEHEFLLLTRVQEGCSCEMPDDNNTTSPVRGGTATITYKIIGTDPCEPDLNADACISVTCPLKKTVVTSIEGSTNTKTTRKDTYCTHNASS